MSLLVVWAGGREAEARGALARGGTLVAWSADAARLLAAMGLPHEVHHLDPAARDGIDDAAIAWTKRFGRVPIRDGRCLRELLATTPDDGAPAWSWWWFVELYLHHSTEATSHVRRIATLRHLLRSRGAREVEAFGLDPGETTLLARTCTAEGILFHGTAPPPPAAAALARVRREARRDIVACAASALKRRLAGPPPLPPPGGVLFLSHAAFWRERDGQPYEHYFDRLIPATAAQGLTTSVVAVGPRSAFRRRGWRERWSDRLGLGTGREPFVHMNRFTDGRVLAATRRALADATRAFDELSGLPGLAVAFEHEGVRFGDLARADLAAALLRQVPWAVRSYEEMRAALRWARPAALCLYAESSGWGRAAIAAARAEGVPTVALQHGILYPRYYSYLHEAGEEECPRPDVTAVFGEAAREFLVARGRYDPRSLSVTGSPRFDDLLAAARAEDRAAVRARLGAGEDDKLVIVASRFRPIRDTHEALGDEFARLVRAVDTLPGVHVIVKPHPAEPADPYRRVVDGIGSTRVRLAPGGETLAALMPAADALVTVESLSAIEALVVDLPVVLLSQPSNLAELVASGVAVGVATGEDPGPALRAALFDEAARGRLAEARRAYLRHVACGVDGRATERILGLIAATARAARPPDAAVVGS